MNDSPVIPATLGRIVHVDTEGTAIDGATRHAGVVCATNEDGTINVRCFAANGGSDFTMHSLRHVSAKEPSDYAGWDWPPRA